MKVTLLNWTSDAVNLLLFTKSTRLNMNPLLMDKINNMSEDERLKELEYMANTIPSSWEFVDYTFLVEGVSRAYTHQQVRTRAGSYAQQSMRVTDQCDFDFVMPEKILGDIDAFPYAVQLVDKIKTAYQTLVQEFDVAPEDARSILPTNIATNIVCKFNLRTFSELCASRSGGRTQSEYQSVVSAMADEVLKVHPWAEMFLFPKERNYFDDIEAFAEREYGNDLVKKGELLKIVDKMRKK